MSRPSFKEFKKKALANPAVKKEYEELVPAYEIRKKLIKLRTTKGLTQAQVAQRMGTKKSNISRLECGEKVSLPTLSTLSKYAAALGCKVNVNFEPMY